MPRHRRRRSRRFPGLRVTVGALAIAVAVLLLGGYPVLLRRLIQPAPLILIAVALVGVLYLATRSFRRRRRRYRTLLELRALTPARFESAVADMLRDHGYRGVQRVGRSGDLAADIICHDAHGRSVVVQCKRYGPGQRIGSPDIQHFIGMITVHHRADYGIFATTTRFTEPAKRLASQHGVVLLDEERLLALATTRRSGLRRGQGAEPLALQPPAIGVPTARV